MNILIDGQTFETPEIHRGIGIYTKNVICNMLKQNYEHEWYIVVSDDKNLCELDPWVRKKLHVIKNAAFCPGADYERNSQYTEALEELIEEKNIDLLWIPNMLMVNVLAPVKKLSCRVCVTVYDIIPYVFPVKEWPEIIVTEYHRRLHYLKEHDNIELLYISKATEKDFEEKIGRVERSCVTTLAADARRFYKKRDKSTAHSRIILFTGGFDYRKNIDGAIDAYAKAMKLYSNDAEFARYKLVIVGACSEEVKNKYYEQFKKKNLDGKVELTGYISEEELGNLYKRAEVFFFPSLYEGFGLPILEAMLGGCYVVSADNSSLPEVCDGHALMCDVNNIDEMAHVLYKGYQCAVSESIEDKNARQDYALSYTWENTAWITLKFWENTSAELHGENAKKEKMAILTPWPMLQTGIANYMYKLVPYLMKYYDVDVYSDVVSSKSECKEIQGVSICNLSAFRQKSTEYQHVLYEIGNNVEFHKSIYELLEEVDGVAEIHDFMLTPFFYMSYFVNGDKNKFKQLLERGYGQEGSVAYDRCAQTSRQPDMQQYPMVHTVANSAQKVIFHNHWSAEQLRTKNMGVIPLACFDKEEMLDDVRGELLDKLKKKYEIDNEIVVGCFGWVNENKRPQVVIQAIRELCDKGYQVKMIFWGKANSQVSDLIQELDMKKYIYVSGYLEEEEYEAALELTDIVINLRYPSMGESSATLCEAFKAGKPVIVSQINQYNEFPDEVCWKVPICSREKEVLAKYLEYLIEHPDVRRSLGLNAMNYAENVLNPEQIALMYYEFLSKR